MMPVIDSPLELSDGHLHIDGVSLITLAQEFGTPCYVYSQAHLLSRFLAYQNGLQQRAGLICFAVKANSNLSVLQTFARAGSGFDIVSGGELARALAAGADPQKILFSGVGKSRSEIVSALQAGIGCFNVESLPELYAIDEVAQSMGLRAPISLRINPDVDPGTHPYISTGLKGNKFGIAANDALAAYQVASQLAGLTVVGIDCHIGSQITQVAPYIEATEKVLDLVDLLQAQGIHLTHIDLGGGLGISYQPEETAPDIAGFVQTLSACLARRGHADKKLILEPGRSLVGNAGVLLTRVEYLKNGESRHFAIVDAAMNDLLRPTLYDAWMNVVPVIPNAEPPTLYDIVGPVCESGDWLARDRSLSLRPGDLLAVCSAGAYGMTMASNYNSRPRPPEIMVHSGRARLIRPRETLQDLLGPERKLLLSHTTDTK